MAGNDADTNSSPSQNDNIDSYSEYLKFAAQACDAGDVVLGLHLYLAAYEKSLQDSYTPKPEVIDGLRQAWIYACRNKERSLAEYIFEKLEPYLSSDEVAQFATELQRLALDKLGEFGLTREDLEEMTDMISQDFFGLDASSLLMRVESGMAPSDMFGPFYKGLTRDRSKAGSDSEKDLGGSLAAQAEAAAPATAAGEKESPTVPNSFEQKPGAQAESASTGSKPAEEKKPAASDADGSLNQVPQVQGLDQKPESPEEGSNLPENGTGLVAMPSGQGKDAASHPDMPRFDLTPFGTLASFDGGNTQIMLPNLLPRSTEQEEKPDDRMSYRDLVGFEAAIETMRAFGVGMNDDPSFKELVETLNKQHGLSKIPITDSFLFRSPVREDANQFMLATMGELDLPAIRMRMEENLQGMPVLCVMASGDAQHKPNTPRNAFEGGGVLILEDIDLWGPPLAEAGSEEYSGFIHAQLSRGAREAINLIRSAAENPDVYVLVSSAQGSAIDNFFYDLLEPLTVVDIELPTAAERADLWANIAKEHPSLRKIDRAELVRYSAGMSRFDIYMAAREAVEDAYKASLRAKDYVPVAAEDVFEKIAAYQPLDSDEYRQLENAVVASFKSELDQLDDLLRGSAE